MKVLYFTTAKLCLTCGIRGVSHLPKVPGHRAIYRWLISGESSSPCLFDAENLHAKDILNDFVSDLMFKIKPDIDELSKDS